MGRYHSESQGNENNGEFWHEISPYWPAWNSQTLLRHSRQFQYQQIKAGQTITLFGDLGVGCVSLPPENVFLRVSTINIVVSGQSVCSAACSASAPQAITNTGCGGRGSSPSGTT
jgi:hypothetical protein